MASVSLRFSLFRRRHGAFWVRSVSCWPVVIVIVLLLYVMCVTRLFALLFLSLLFCALAISYSKFASSLLFICWSWCGYESLFLFFICENNVRVIGLVNRMFSFIFCFFRLASASITMASPVHIS